MRLSFFSLLFVTACVGTIGGPEVVPASGGTQRLRRLSVYEYVRSVKDLTGVVISEHRFVEDSLETGYDDGPVSLVVEDDQVGTYALVAADVASQAVSKSPLLLTGGCDPTTRGEGACRDAFFRSFATRAYRRPLTDGERARLGALMDDASSVGGFWEGVRAATAAALQSPSFLYREEMGVPIGRGRARLGPYEIASELSYFLIGAPPDDALLSAAADGELTTDADVAREAKRLLATPRAREQLRHLIDLWLGTWPLLDTPKDALVYPSFTPELKQAMRAELDRFYEHVIFDGRGTLEELFTSKESFVTAPLAKHYGLDVKLGPNDVAKVEISDRPGVLSRAGFLSVHASASSSNPIARGVFVLSSILCAAPPPPPPNVLARTFEPVGARTTRERVEQHAKDPFCMSCHERIDGIGFGFEELDGIGARRTQENGVPVDPSGFLRGSDGADGAFRGAFELEEKLVESPRVPACFARQMLEAALGAPLARGQDVVIEGFDAKTRVLDLVARVVTSSAFLEREIAR